MTEILRKIAVIGGGPAGLFFAIMARKNFPRCDIAVYEQNPRNATFGWGIILSEGGYSCFAQADAETAQALVDASFPTRDRLLIVNGERIDIEGGPIGHAIARLKMLNVLQDCAERLGIPVHYEARIENPDQLGADLIVGTDGVNSVVRKNFDGEFGTCSWTLSNRMAWYGTPQKFESPILSFKSTEFGTFWAAAYPHQADMSTFVAECDADAWMRSGMHAMSEADRLAFAEQIFAEELGGHKLLSNKSTWGSLPVTRTRRWHVGNRVLVGDALRSPHPSIGSGTRIAMEDAVGLINALVASNGDVGTALPAYQQEHSPQSAKLVKAMEASALWYENVGERLELFDPATFAFDFMTRTGRLNEGRLRSEYPQFMERYQNDWQRWLTGQAEKSPAIQNPPVVAEG